MRKWLVNGTEIAKRKYIMVGWRTLPPQQGARVLIPRACECFLMWWQRNFAGVIKGLDMRRLPWIVRVGSCNHKGPHEREGGGGSQRGAKTAEARRCVREERPASQRMQAGSRSREGKETKP